MQSRLRRTISRMVIVGSVLGLGVGTQVVVASPGTAVVRAGGPEVDRDVSGARDQESPHVQHKPLTPDELPPLSAFVEQQRDDYDAPPDTGKQRAAAAVCDVADFSGQSGAALVTAIKNAAPSCVNTLFGLTSANAPAVFGEPKMVTVATALRDNAVAYAGDNSTGTLQLVLFLRAGYYVQSKPANGVPAYGTTLKSAVRSALDAFFANPRSGDVNDINGDTLNETVILIDSAQENTRYIYVVKRLLTAYNSSYNAYKYMRSSVNSVFTVLFRGHYDSTFVTAVTNDPSLLDVVSGFANDHFGLLGGDYYYLPYNAGRELSRFVQHTALQAKVRPLVKALVGRSAITGPTAKMWVALADMVDYYDTANCSYYGVCDYRAQIMATVLPISHDCGPTLRIRAQEITTAQLNASCASLANQDAYFHSLVNDNGPIPGDRNTSLEVVVFNSSVDYQTYAGALYDIATDNGGMYLEGTPEVAGNQPRFIAYEDTRVLPTFAIWNLNHEYTHYLDGRFNMYGNFNASQSTPTTWWTEGFAEYVSYSYRDVVYQAAITEAAKKTFTLREVFDTTYEHEDSTRTYRWGYLAARYMLEKHPADVATVLGHYRAGSWSAARSFLTGLNYTTDWNTWLTACASGACGGGGTPTNQAPVAAFSTAVNGTTVTFTDGSTDSDGTIASRAWDFGDGGTSTAANPSRTYAASGTYTVRLTVTDNGGKTGTTTKTVTVTAPLPQCPGSDTRALGKNCVRTNAAATSGNHSYFYLLVPAGTTQLKITTTGGTGNADLYYSPSSWATPTNYSKRSATAGNAETLTITSPQAGYHYITLYGTTAFTGVSVSSEY
ncbi:collagenase [Nonomuraea sp. NPDC046570]|uniref:collagenase n=1 Tax=Nonomuraea sp. NPDC046570 TaxID=3155255 RepID=UPI0033D5046A